MSNSWNKQNAGFLVEWSPSPTSAPAADDVTRRLAEIDTEFQAAYDRDIAPGHNSAVLDLDTK